MALSRCYACIKYLMFVFNIVFWLVGCAILGIGIWVRVDPNFRHYVESGGDFSYLYTGAYILVAVGVIIGVIGFVGCFGAIKENQWLLAAFFCCLFVVLSCLVAAAVWTSVTRTNIKEAVTASLNRAVKNYASDTSARAFMDKLHVAVHCCGSTNLGGEGAPSWMPYQREPPSTCNLKNWSKACDKELYRLFAANLLLVGGIAITIAVVMVAGLLLAALMWHALRKEGAQGHYGLTACSKQGRLSFTS